MHRGEIYLVDLDPARGSEASKRRPAVVVSNDAANATAARLGRGVVTVVPVTSNLDRVHPFQVRLPAEETGLDRDSKPTRSRFVRSRPSGSGAGSARCRRRCSPRWTTPCGCTCRCDRLVAAMAGSVSA